MSMCLITVIFATHVSCFLLCYGKDLDSSVSTVTGNELSNHNSIHDRCTDCPSTHIQD